MERLAGLLYFKFGILPRLVFAVAWMILPATNSSFGQFGRESPQVQFPSVLVPSLDHKLASLEHYRGLFQDYPRLSDDPQSLHERGREFLDDYLEFRRRIALYKERTSLLERLVVQGRELIADGCEDPLIWHAHAFVLDSSSMREQALARSQAASARFEKSRYSPKLRALPFTYTTILAKHHSKEKVAKHWGSKMLGSWLDWLDLYATTEEPPLTDSQRRSLFGKIEAGLKGFSDTLNPELVELLHQYMQRPSADPWIGHMMLGQLHHRRAWKIRGNGYASKVEQDVWPKFRDETRLAAEHFLKAYEANSYLPEAPKYLIRIARDGGVDESPFDWFQRCIDIEFDHAEAYADYRWTLLPRWGGSHEQLLDFGIQCAQTGFYQSEVPMELFQCAKLVEREQKSKYQFVKEQNLYPLFSEALRGRLNAVEQFDNPSKRVVAELRTILLGLAIAAEEYADAKQLFQELGGELSPVYARHFKIHGSRAMARIHALTEFPDRIADLEHWFDREEKTLDQQQLMRQSLRQLRDRCESEMSARYLDAHLKALDQEIQFASGETLPLTFKPGLPGWYGETEHYQVVDQNTVIGDTKLGDDEPKIPSHSMRIRTYAQFRGPVEIHADIQVERYASKLFQFGVLLGDGYDVSGSRLFWVDPKRRHAGLAKPAAAFALNPQFEVPKHLHIRVWGPQQIEFMVNGIQTDPYVGDDFKFSKNHVGLQFAWDREYRGRVKISNLTVAKLTLPQRPRSDEAADLDSHWKSLVSYYDEMIRREPKFDQHYAQHGTFLMVTGQYEKAIADFDRALALSPKRVYTRRSRANCLFNLGRFAEGFDEYKIAIEQAKGRGKLQAQLKGEYAYFRCSVPAEELRDPAEALEVAKTTMRHGRRLIAVHYYLAFAQFTAGQQKAAEKTLAGVENTKTIRRPEDFHVTLTKRKERIREAIENKQPHFFDPELDGERWP